mmetsp:Transcript_7011/g.12948  ORF Transcript_7011/g.12948 Transcript_7011/m.12948 type:complete len:227 (+) Transcript_7011:22-702(+)
MASFRALVVLTSLLPFSASFSSAGIQRMPTTKGLHAISDQSSSATVAKKRSAFEDGNTPSFSPRLIGLDSFNAALAQAQSDGDVLCIRYVATWCPLCKRMGIYWNKLIHEMQTKEGIDGAPRVRFFEVEFSESKDVIKALQEQHAQQEQAAWEATVGPNVARASDVSLPLATLNRMPWVQVYRPGDATPAGSAVAGVPCKSFGCDSNKVKTLGKDLRLTVLNGAAL